MSDRQKLTPPQTAVGPQMSLLGRAVSAAGAVDQERASHGRGTDGVFCHQCAVYVPPGDERLEEACTFGLSP